MQLRAGNTTFSCSSRSVTGNEHEIRKRSFLLVVAVLPSRGLRKITALTRSASCDAKTSKEKGI